MTISLTYKILKKELELREKRNRHYETLALNPDEAFKDDRVILQYCGSGYKPEYKLHMKEPQAGFFFR